MSHSRLTVNLANVAENYRRIKSTVNGVNVAAVLKGDAYNLGMAAVAGTLAEEGARCFFVAYCEEALELRRILNDLNVAAKIYVLAGLHRQFFGPYLEHDLIPVLNSLDHIKGWAQESQRKGIRLPGVIQVDIGLNRLGLTLDELTTLVTQTDLLDHLTPELIIGHLPFGNDHKNPANRDHLALFQEFRSKLPAWRGSIANSAAVFLGTDYHQDIVRTGSALLGVNPKRGQPNPMLPVLSLESRIIHIRDLEAGQTVGYGGTFRADRKTALGIVSIGASDGLDRQVSLSGHGTAYIDGHRAAIIGSGGSDMIFVDLTEIPGHSAVVGQTVEFLGPNIDLEAMAKQAGATEYDILTGFGQRPGRIYLKNR